MTLAKVADAVGGTAPNVVHLADTGSGDPWAIEHDDALASITYDDTYAVHSLTHGYKVDPGSGTSHSTYRGWSPISRSAAGSIPWHRFHSASTKPASTSWVEPPS